MFVELSISGNMVKYVGPLSFIWLKKSSVISVRFSYNGAVLRLKPQKSKHFNDGMHVVLGAGSYCLQHIQCLVVDCSMKLPQPFLN